MGASSGVVGQASLDALLEHMSALVERAVRKRDQRPPDARHELPNLTTCTVIDVADTTAEVQLDEDAPGHHVTVGLGMDVSPGQRAVVAHTPNGGCKIIAASPAIAGPAQKPPPMIKFTPGYNGVFGNSVIDCAYKRIDTLVIVNAQITLGSTHAYPASAAGITFTMPFTAVRRGWLHGMIGRFGGGRYPLNGFIDAGSAVVTMLYDQPGIGLQPYSSSAPGSIGPGSVIGFDLKFETNQ